MNGRALGCVAGVVAIPAIAILACGQEAPRGDDLGGVLDDAGVYHAADGALLFGPGSACTAFDAAALVEASTPTSGTSTLIIGSCSANSDCDPLVPTAGGVFPVACRVDHTCQLFATSWPTCRTGELGDRFCQAYAQQFVVAPGAVARMRCDACFTTKNQTCSTNPKSMPQPPTGSRGVCVPACCEGLMCVQRAGGATPACELPCDP